MGENVIDDALRFLAKNRKEGKTCPRPVPCVHPRDDLDDDQRLVWILTQMAMSDSLPPNDDDSDRQLLALDELGNAWQQAVSLHQHTADLELTGKE